MLNLEHGLACRLQTFREAVAGRTVYRLASKFLQSQTACVSLLLPVPLQSIRKSEKRKLPLISFVSILAIDGAAAASNSIIRIRKHNRNDFAAAVRKLDERKRSSNSGGEQRGEEQKHSAEFYHTPICYNAELFYLLHVLQHRLTISF